MKRPGLLSCVLLLTAFACVDRLIFDIDGPNGYDVFVSGSITDQPGPYRIELNQAFDIQSKKSIKIPVTAKRVVLYDDKGAIEVLNEVTAGVYQTKANGIRGRAFGIYTLRLEFYDGRIYESIPDTLYPAGQLDTIYYKFSKNIGSSNETQYGFDIYLTSSNGINTTNRFVWMMSQEFEADTDPGKADDPTRFGCNVLPFSITCNYYPICSGIKNVGTNRFPVFERVKPCECCKCWYKVFSNRFLISDNFFMSSTTMKDFKGFTVPLNGFYFMHKVKVEVSQRSLSGQAFRVWKAIDNQKSAINSIFQPVSGKMPISFVQISGRDHPLQGLFYASGVRSKIKYIHRYNVPNTDLIPSVEEASKVSCLGLFPNATTVKPASWID